MFFIEGCTSGYNRQVAVYDCVLLRENKGCSTVGRTATTIYSGCTSGYNRECSSFTSGYYCIRHGCFTSGYYSVIYYLIISDIRRTRTVSWKTRTTGGWIRQPQKFLDVYQLCCLIMSSKLWDRRTRTRGPRRERTRTSSVWIRHPQQFLDEQQLCWHVRKM